MVTNYANGEKNPNHAALIFYIENSAFFSTPPALVHPSCPLLISLREMGLGFSKNLGLQVGFYLMWGAQGSSEERHNGNFLGFAGGRSQPCLLEGWGKGSGTGKCWEVELGVESAVGRGCCSSSWMWEHPATFSIREKGRKIVAGGSLREKREMG